jgi:hypothetical protein
MPPAAFISAAPTNAAASIDGPHMPATPLLACNNPIFMVPPLPVQAPIGMPKTPFGPSPLPPTIAPA